MSTLIRVGCLAELQQFQKIASNSCDVVELRWDVLKHNGVSVDQAIQALQSRQLPVLLTPRSASEGGLYAWKKGERLNDVKELLPHVDGIDIELAHVKEFQPVLEHLTKQKLLTVLSHHSLKKPLSLAQLKALLSRFQRHRGHAYKIASLAHTQTHLQTLAHFLCLNPKQPLALMAVGTQAHASRLVLPLLGSRMVYGHLGIPTAPNQPSIQELSKALRGTAIA